MKAVNNCQSAPDKGKHFQNHDFKNEFCEVIRNHGFGNAFQIKRGGGGGKWFIQI
jgi:hypothetical protein